MKKLLAVSLILGTILFPISAQAALPPAQVYIVTGSAINMVSRESKVPVSVQNNYDRPVKVRVHAQSANNALNVTKFVSITIPANSRKDALIPISVLAGGKFNVKVWLTTFTDIRIGNSVNLKLTANPDVEQVILIGFGALVIALIGLGAFRMLRRGKARA